jgi:hypothetical protein
LVASVDAEEGVATGRGAEGAVAAGLGAGVGADGVVAAWAGSGARGTVTSPPTGANSTRAALA